MTTIVTRAGKGTSLSWSEVDANFTNLNTDKLEASTIGSTVQAHSANLDEYATVNPTAAGLALLDDIDAAAQRTTLSLNNVDNTSDATKNAATAILTNKTIAASTNTVEAMSGPNNSPLSFRNKLINGEVTRINQRGVANWAAVANGAYGYDRWKKIDASNMTQIIEAGNFRPNTVHTLSGIGVTTQQITSPASGNWTLPNIPITATNVQLEEGAKATPFEVRHIAFELSLCQRYYERSSVAFWAAGNVAGAVSTSVGFLVQKRTNPTITFTDTTGNLNRITTYTSGGVLTSAVANSQSGNVTGFAAGIATADVAISANWIAEAEL